ncbi:MAG: hypothetical protein J2P21_29855 [Chloracidobacterium sp.]|nr:hypothetical protein [Chloracidobacterium sp.]
MADLRRCLANAVQSARQLEKDDGPAFGDSSVKISSIPRTQCSSGALTKSPSAHQTCLVIVAAEKGRARMWYFNGDDLNPGLLIDEGGDIFIWLETIAMLTFN